MRGQADYGIYSETPVATGIADPGEAAARLGSINVYDRRGWTVWMDDFEAPAIRWKPYSLSGGVDPILDTVQALRGAQSVYCSTGATAGSKSYIKRKFPLFRRGKVGIEIWLGGNTTSPGYAYMKADMADGVNISTAEWRLYIDTNKLYIVSGRAEVLVSSRVFALITDKLFIPIKIVADMDTDLFTRIMAGPDETDISAYPLGTSLPAATDYVDIEIGIVGADVAAMSAWLDNFILTQNEP